MVIGEDYNQDPIPFGKCYTQSGWVHDGEIEIFKFRYDYFTLAKQYNLLAEENNWQLVNNPSNLIMVWTQLPCKGYSLNHE